MPESHEPDDLEETECVGFMSIAGWLGIEEPDGDLLEEGATFRDVPEWHDLLRKHDIEVEMHCTHQTTTTFRRLTKYAERALTVCNDCGLPLDCSFAMDDDEEEIDDEYD